MAFAEFIRIGKDRLTKVQGAQNCIAIR